MRFATRRNRQTDNLHLPRTVHASQRRMFPNRSRGFTEGVWRELPRNHRRQYGYAGEILMPFLIPGGPFARMGRHGAAAVALAVCVSQIGACADYEPFQPPNNSAIPEGPGLLTGPEGEWVLFRMRDGSTGGEIGDETPND